jgi:hypothetical protein
MEESDKVFAMIKRTFRQSVLLDAVSNSNSNFMRDDFNKIFSHAQYLIGEKIRKGEHHE